MKQKEKLVISSFQMPEWDWRVAMEDESEVLCSLLIAEEKAEGAVCCSKEQKSFRPRRQSRGPLRSLPGDPDP
jgi:hypothetical protein